MSFNPPQNIPTFDTNRAQEDNFWKQRTDGRSGPPSSSYAYPRSNPSSSTTTNGYLDTHGQHARKSSLKDRIGGLMNDQSDRDLPMYKDKPRFPSGARGSIWSILFPRGRRKRWGILGVLVFFVVWYSGIFTSSNPEPIVSDEPAKQESWWAWWQKEEVDWTARRDQVRRAFVISWDDYAKHAWGMDNYSPVSRKSSMMVKSKTAGDTNPAGMGWIIVDALDTAMIMNLTSRVTQAREWIATSLNFAQVDGEVSTFETTIRILGGLLSAHYLSTTFPTLAPQKDDDTGMRGEDLYIEKAVDLADRLLSAFDTPTGIPLSSVNLNRSIGVPSNDVNGVSSTAEAATLQLELKYLSKLTGEPLYWEKAEQIMKAVDAPRKEGGLLPIFIDPITGSFRGTTIRLGSRGDSYYEYLIKQYLQTGSREEIYSEMWEEALEGIKKYLITYSKHANFTVLGERVEGLSGPLSGKMDHLVCFMPGTIALGVTGGQTVQEAKARMGTAWGKKQEEDLLLAEELLKTCWGMYAVTPTSLAPEIAYMVLDTPHRSYEASLGGSDRTQPHSRISFEKSDESLSTNDRSDWKKDFDIRPNDVHNLQRPETVESLYYLYRITRNEKYRHWGWQMFRAFIEQTKVTDEHGVVTGYTSLESVLRDPDLDKWSRKSSITGINSVMVGNRHVDPGNVAHDSMEGFWLAETLKYLYLLFSDDATDGQASSSVWSSGTNQIADEWFDLSKVVINTEAHFFPRFDIKDSKVWKTGWTRVDRKIPDTPVKETGSGSGSDTDADAHEPEKRVYVFGDPE